MPHSAKYYDFIFSICAATISFPLVFVCTYQFFKHKSKHYFTKRHPILTGCELLAIAILILAHPISAFVGWKYHCSTAPVRAVVFSTFTTLWLWLVMTRLFLLNFDHHYSQALASRQWRKEIDPDEDCFWIRTRQTWGNPSWLLKVSAVPLLPICGVLMYLSLGHYRTTLWDLSPMDIAFHVVSYTLLLICGLSMAWMYSKLPVVSDSLYIRSEIRLCVIFFFFGVGLYLTWELMTPSLGRSIFGAFAWTLSFPSWCFFSTLYVIRKNSPRDDILKKCFMDINFELSPRSGVETILRWQKVARHPEGFAMFTNFLCSEFAVENILFLTEWMQFKMQNLEFISNVLYEDLDDDESEDARDSLSDATSRRSQKTQFSVELPLDDLPFSKKVSNAHPSTLGHAFYLYSKYIEAGSAPFEINIDYETRLKLMEIFAPRRESFLRSFTNRSQSSRSRGLSQSVSNTLLKAEDRLESDGADIVEISELFDQCGRQISNLLRASFTRFCCTEEYKLLIAKYPELAYSPVLSPLSPGKRALSALFKIRDIRI